jgi:hypothetical protein
MQPQRLFPLPGNKVAIFFPKIRTRYFQAKNEVWRHSTFHHIGSRKKQMPLSLFVIYFILFFLNENARILKFVNANAPYWQ